jgi:hypothetical protein
MQEEAKRIAAFAARLPKVRSGRAQILGKVGLERHTRHLSIALLAKWPVRAKNDRYSP